MAITKISFTPRRFIGLSTDTKPTTEVVAGDAASPIPIGSTFYQYDDYKVYICRDGTNWELCGYLYPQS